MLRIIILTVLAIRAFAANVECSVPYSIMYAIASNEHHPNKDVGYPYLISFNNEINTSFLSGFKINWLDKRTIDCENLNKCIDLTKQIIDKNIFNIDLGAYQLNYYWHKHSLVKYFSLKESYAIACNIVEKLADAYGWSWNTLGRYHSNTEKHRIPYSQRLAIKVNSYIGEKND